MLLNKEADRTLSHSPLVIFIKSLRWLCYGICYAFHHHFIWFSFNLDIVV